MTIRLSTSLRFFTKAFKSPPLVLQFCTNTFLRLSPYLFALSSSDPRGSFKFAIGFFDADVEEPLSPSLSALLISPDFGAPFLGRIGRVSLSALVDVPFLAFASMYAANSFDSDSHKLMFHGSAIHHTIR